MTDNFLTERHLHPGCIPSDAYIQRIFWDCLSEAEHTFGGPREAHWTYAIQLRPPPLGPETINDGQSQVTVWLTTDRSWVGNYFEAAHESVHCLNPNIPSGSGKYIEEAVASAFSLEVVRRIFGQWAVERCTVSPDYQRARELAYEIDHDVIRLGLRLRGYAGALGRATVKAFEDLYPDAPPSAALDSLRQFPRH